MRRRSIIAFVIGLILGATGVASATTAGFYLIGGNATVKLKGTGVICITTAGGKGTVMLCGRTNSNEKVMVGQGGIIVFKGSQLATATLLYNSPNWSESPSAGNGGLAGDQLGAQLKPEIAAKLSTLAPSVTLDSLSCQIDLNGQTGSCIGQLSAPAANEKGTALVSVTFGQGGTYVWKVESITCQDATTGQATTC